MVTSPHEAIVSLIEIIVVVIQVSHCHHAFAVVVVYFAIDAITLYATDMSIILLTYLDGHKLHHLVFYGVSFSILCHQFHIAAMFAEFLIMFFVCRPAALLIFG